MKHLFCYIQRRLHIEKVTFSNHASLPGCHINLKPIVVYCKRGGMGVGHTNGGAKRGVRISWLNGRNGPHGAHAYAGRESNCFFGDVTISRSGARSPRNCQVCDRNQLCERFMQCVQAGVKVVGFSGQGRHACGYGRELCGGLGEL